MAISKDKKESQVSELGGMLANSKLTAFASYDGLSVAEMQELRRSAREAGVTIKVIKNRLVRVAMNEIDTYKDTDASMLKGQLLYAISPDDEVAAAQVLDKFGKTHPALKLAGGFSDTGANLAEADVKSLAGLPNKNQLIAQTIAQLLSPVHDVTNALSGNLHALLDGVEAKAAS